MCLPRVGPLVEVDEDVHAERAAIAVDLVEQLPETGGGELVVSRQNTEAPSADGELSRSGGVRIAWRPEQAFTIPSGEGT